VEILSTSNTNEVKIKIPSQVFVTEVDLVNQLSPHLSFPNLNVHLLSPDPHVVTRVREFLATPPTFLDQGGLALEAQYFHTITTTQVTITPSSPLKVSSSSGKPSKIRQPSVVSSVSPNRTALVTSPSTASPPSKKKSIAVREDEIDSSKGSPNHHITLSNDIFMNHAYSLQENTPNSFHQELTGVGGPKSLIPIRSPPHSTNGDKNTSNNSSNNRARNNAVGVFAPSPFGPTTVGNRKNYETFVMTGDAILNVSKLRNDDSIW